MIWRCAVPIAALAMATLGCTRGDEEQAARPGAQGEMAEEAPLPPDIGNPTPRVVLETTLGRIVLELDREKAPKTVDNFVSLVENQFYDGLTFHRVLPGFMIQAGGFTPELRRRNSPYPPIENEADNGLENVRGSVAMARTADPHSASSQFFINLVDNPNLDYSSPTPRGWGYAVFGHVVEGMDTVDAIADVQTRSVGPHEAVPVEPVIIERAYIQ